MSEASLPFNEKIYPTNAKISSGKKLQQEWEKSIKNPEEFWAEKRLHPLCFSRKAPFAD